MKGNAFGYPCLTLDELIEALLEVRAGFPPLGAEPVWIGNIPPLMMPINNVQVVKPPIGLPRLLISVEKG